MADYPKEWERHFTLEDGRAVYVRPIRPQDEVLYGPFLAAVTPDDVRFRFLGPVKEFSHALLTYFTHLDYARAMAFIALDAAPAIRCTDWRVYFRSYNLARGK